jgi:hypothetical protein
MKCDCWDKAYRPVLKLLDEAAGNMYYATPEFDLHQALLHDIVKSLRTKFTCIDRCWEKDSEEPCICIPDEPNTNCPSCF